MIPNFDANEFDRYEWSQERAAEMGAQLMAATTLPQLNDLMNDFAGEACLLLPNEQRSVTHAFNTCAFQLKRQVQRQRERAALRPAFAMAA